MKREYDFSKLQRAEPKYLKRLRSPVTMRVDQQVVAYFKRLAEVMIHKPTPATTALETCITKQIKTWKFPKPADGRAFSILFPVVFDPRAQPTK